MTIDTKRLRELAEAATPGPWEHVAVRHMQHEVFTPDDDRAEGDASINCWYRTDAAFIAAANPQAVIALLNRAADLEHELAAAIRWIESTQFRVDDDAHKAFVERLKKTLGGP